MEVIRYERLGYRLYDTEKKMVLERYDTPSRKHKKKILIYNDPIVTIYSANNDVGMLRWHIRNFICCGQQEALKNCVLQAYHRTDKLLDEASEIECKIVSTSTCKPVPCRLSLKKIIEEESLGVLADKLRG